jgi:hypothetical protein
MMATYRLIKDDGHAADENCVGDVYLELPSPGNSFPGYWMLV